MRGQRRTVATILGLFLLVIGSALWYLHSHNVAVLDPKGTIASKERRLIIEATLLMLIVVVPVYIATFFIAFKYREDNTRAKYSPDWDHSVALESLWWAVPILIIGALAAITWRSSYQLDPFKPLSSSTAPLTIEAVALQWKWLFIYPGQDVASVNYVQLPLNTPVTFEITADAPMNSLWIPQLGGQIYAMSGMSTELHLMATQPGTYYGSSANISGAGFANMHFNVVGGSSSDFNNWVAKAKKSPLYLSGSAYNNLARPSTSSAPVLYSSSEGSLYNQILNKYSRPAPAAPSVDYHVASSANNLSGGLE